MERVTVDDVEAEPHPMGVNRERRDLSTALGTEHMAAVHYELEPGEQFSGGLHTHHDQEEIFYVLEGTATFEYGPDGDQEEVVEAGEVIRFAPGEFQCGHNQSDDRVVGVALAAPGSRHDWDALESFAPCGECDEVTSHGVREPDEAFVIYCNECGNEVQIA
jgi:uncharacterized cupin superfamily protein